MTIFDDMPFNDVVALYNEKHKAIKQGNLNQLNILKRQCPELFISFEESLNIKAESLPSKRKGKQNNLEIIFYDSKSANVWDK